MQIKEVTLTLTADEAVIIKNILGKISGDQLEKFKLPNTYYQPCISMHKVLSMVTTEKEDDAI